ncbi:hypothetical protein M758_UG180700 [Ceratodon purpureus]|nr:hypothetical protein M758_UG180700 [Ceratodon purpureus]
MAALGRPSAAWVRVFSDTDREHMEDAHGREHMEDAVHESSDDLSLDGCGAGSGDVHTDSVDELTDFEESDPFAQGSRRQEQEPDQSQQDGARRLERRSRPYRGPARGGGSSQQESATTRRL